MRSAADPSQIDPTAPLYRIRRDCRLCGSNDMEVVVPLAPIPIATPNFRLTDATPDHSIFRKPVPLDLHLCGECGLLQVPVIGNPNIQYGNYVYTTSLSLGLRQHFAAYADDVTKSIAPSPGDLVVEIGSNDGTLLGLFKSRGMRVVGVDPAVTIARAASAAGIETHATFFGAKIAQSIRSEHGAAKIIIANNVIANIDDLSDLTTGVEQLLAADGVFLFETQYGADVINHNLLDTVYHEHLSYFNVKPLVSFTRRFGLEVIDVLRNNSKGGSIRVVAQKVGGPRPVSRAVEVLVGWETAQGMYDPVRYRAFADEIAAIRSELAGLVGQCRREGKPVAGYGVSVGTTTLLHQFALTGEIDHLFDDDPDKEPFLRGPGYDIPVARQNDVLRLMPGIIIVFAWRYADPIIAKNSSYAKAGGRFVVPLPRVTLR